MQLIGSDFIVTPDEALELGLGRAEGLEYRILNYVNGRDITSTPRNVMAIDLFGLEPDEVRDQFPEVYQWVFERVKPERDQNRDKKTRENWWVHGRPREELRKALEELSRYLSIVETSKHRFFVFLDSNILPDNKLVNIALEDAYFLGVLSSRIHVAWALAAGSRLGVGNDPVYVKSNCFEKFPFPNPSDAQKARIRDLAEQLDAHRKRQQALHPRLTLTDMYNVLEKLRAGEPLTAKEKVTHEQGLVSILKQLHDDLDTSVFAAYGWPPDLSDEEILQRLVDLNAERAAEEANGLIRWLRPEYQAPNEVKATQSSFLPDEETAAAVAPTVAPQSWPTALKDRATAVRAALSSLGGPADLPTVAAAFDGKRTPKRLAEVEEILEMLVALGQVEVADGRYAAG